MLLLRVFLLVMLIGESKTQVQKIPVEGCDQMSCFAPEMCDDKTKRSDKMVLLTGGKSVVDDCDAIVKIRSYSKNFYSVVMESYNIVIDSLKIEHGKTIFECQRTGTKVSAKYNNQEVQLLPDKRTSTANLMCAFFVKNTENVFDETDNSQVKMFSPLRVAGVYMKITTFMSECSPTCDPDAVAPKDVGSVESKTVVKPDIRLADLACPTDYTLMIRNGAAFEKAQGNTVSCKETGGKHAFDPLITEARCEVDTCTQCPDALDGFETFKEGICTKMRCKNEFRIKVDGAAPEAGSAECKYVENENKHVWQFKGKTLTSSTATCVEKMKCFKDDAAVKKLCPTCILGTDNMPTCSTPTDKIMYETIQMNLSCDDATGTVWFKAVGYEGANFDIKLTCGTKAAGGAAEDAAKAGAAGDGTPYIVLGVVLGLGLLGGVGVGLFCFMKRRKQGKTPPATGAKVDPQGEKKEANPGEDTLAGFKTEAEFGTTLPQTAEKETEGGRRNEETNGGTTAGTTVGGTTADISGTSVTKGNETTTR